jgi:hypothetical protein
MVGAVVGRTGLGAWVAKFAKYMTPSQLQSLSPSGPVGEDSYLFSLFHALLGGRHYSEAELGAMDLERLRAAMRQHLPMEQGAREQNMDAGELRRAILAAQQQRRNVTVEMFVEALGERVVSAGVTLLVEQEFDRVWKDRHSIAASLQSAMFTDAQSRFFIPEEERTALGVMLNVPGFVMTYVGDTVQARATDLWSSGLRGLDEVYEAASRALDTVFEFRAEAAEALAGQLAAVAVHGAVEVEVEVKVADQEVQRQAAREQAGVAQFKEAVRQRREAARLAREAARVEAQTRFGVRRLRDEVKNAQLLRNAVVVGDHVISKTVLDALNAHEVKGATFKPVGAKIWNGGVDATVGLARNLVKGGGVDQGARVANYIMDTVEVVSDTLGALQAVDLAFRSVTAAAADKSPASGMQSKRPAVPLPSAWAERGAPITTELPFSLRSPLGPAPDTALAGGFLPASLQKKDVADVGVVGAMGSAVKAARGYLAWNGGRLPTTDDLLRYFTSRAKFEDEHRERKLSDALWDVSARISERALASGDLAALTDPKEILRGLAREVAGVDHFSQDGVDALLAALGG